MIDTNIALREFLLLDAPLVAQVGSKIYSTRLPINFSLAKAIEFAPTGGDANWYQAEQENDVDFKCYGTTSIEARTVYRALFDALHSQQNRWIGTSYFLIHAMEINSGQDLIDPDTAWPFVYCSFSVKFRL